MHKKVLIAIYDDLRRNQEKHYCLNIGDIDNRYIGEFISEPLYDLYFKHNDNKVLLYENGVTSVTFDVFEVSPIIFNNLKFMYKDIEASAFRGSYSKEINTPFGEAMCFFSLQQVNGTCSQIEEGDCSVYFGKKII